MVKIYCVEQQKEGFDKKTFEELQDMVGWIEPAKNDKDTWTVTMADGGMFDCDTQETAFIMAGIEEIKAMKVDRW